VKCSFVHLRTFTADCERLNLDDESLRELELLIMDRSEMGRVIPGTGGLRKIRFSPSSWKRGKSGAIRACYAYFVSAEQVFLVAAYGKNEKENLTPAEKAAYRALLREIDASLRRST
jgi:hypothetical protein